MSRWLFTLREIRRRPGRAFLTFFSVVLGVAAVVSMSSSSRAARASYDRMYRAMAGRASLEVTAVGTEGFDQDLLEQFRSIPQVKTVVPVIQQPVRLYLPSEEAVQVTLLAIDPDQDLAVRDYDVAEGELFREGKGMLLEVGFARNLGLKVGDKIRMPLPKQRTIADVTIRGLLAPKGAATFSQGGTAFLPLKTTQQIFGMGNNVDAAQLVLKEGANEKQVHDQLVRELPPGLQVRRPAARTQLAERTLDSSERGLRIATSLSLVIALFIIFNTFLMNVSERRRQLAILRAIGATRSQVARMLLTEGMVLGMAGTCLGMVLGHFGGRMMTVTMGKLMATNLSPPDLAPGPLILGGVFGIVVSLLGVYLPARKAGRVSPLEGMGSVLIEDREGASHLMSWIGGTMALTAIGLAGLTILGYPTAAIADYTPIGFMVGVVFLTPAMLPWLEKLATLFLRPLLGIEGRLARLQLMRRRMRTGFTSGVLLVSLATGVALANLTFDNIQDIRDWYQQTFVGDFYVRVMIPKMETGEAGEMSSDIVNDIRSLAGVRDVDSLIIHPMKLADESVVLIAGGHEPNQPLKLDLVSGDEDTIRQRLIAGEIVLSSVIAQRLKVGIGDKVTLPTEQGKQDFVVAGLSNDYVFGGAVIHLDRDVAAKALNIKGVHAFAIRAAPEALDSVGTSLRKICLENGLILQSYADLQRLIHGMINSVSASMYGLLSLGFLVAAFGIVNTLTMNVLEQTREIGMLRTVAMTRRQIRKLILSQAVTIGVYGLLPGIATGVAASFLMNRCLPAVIGHEVPFSVRPVLLGGSLAMALVVVIVAALIPAERAARLNLLEAMKTE